MLERRRNLTNGGVELFQFHCRRHQPLLLLCLPIVDYSAAEHKAKLSNHCTCSLLALIRFPGSLKGFFASGFYSTGSSLPSDVRIHQFGCILADPSVYFCLGVEFAILW